MLSAADVMLVDSGMLASGDVINIRNLSGKHINCSSCKNNNQHTIVHIMLFKI